MARTDLVLLHPPSVYDFRRMPCFYGPISDVVPSTPVFEMYPIGFLTILGHLRKHGYSVRIVNVAMKMLHSDGFDVEGFIRSLNPVLFGIDLHWLVHAHGGIELASIVKKYHPDTPVIFGGLSSSYYHRELMEYPQVDFVMRGDSAEEPLRLLLERLKQRLPPVDVPNLTWRDEAGAVRVNELTHVEPSLDGLSFDYRNMVKSAIRHWDIIGHLPFTHWWKYPIVPIIPWRGCARACATCGGSSQVYREHCGRARPAYRSPEVLAGDVKNAVEFLRGPLMVIGDVRQAGDDYAYEFLAHLEKLKVRNEVVIELFYPAERPFLERIARAIPNFNLELSPESHDETIRKSFRYYTNADMEQSIADALELGCKRVDIFFMTGLSGQSAQSVDDTVTYCEGLIGKFAHVEPARVYPFISPLAPFLDPGSAAFENPKKHGYRLRFRSLEEHRQALAQPSWKYVLNYETEWMTRDEIVESTYAAAERLNGLKAKYGLVPKGEAKRIDRRIQQARAAVALVDRVMDDREGVPGIAELHGLRAEFSRLSRSTICRKEELHWPMPIMRFNPLSVLRAALART